MHKSHKDKGEKSNKKTYRIEKVGNQGIIRAIGKLGKLCMPPELLTVSFGGLSKTATLGLEVSRKDIVTLILVNDTKEAGGGAWITIDILAERRDAKLASLLGGVDGLEEREGVAVGKLTKDVGG